MIFFAALSYCAEFSATWQQCSLLMLVQCTRLATKSHVTYCVTPSDQRGVRDGETPSAWHPHTDSCTVKLDKK